MTKKILLVAIESNNYLNTQLLFWNYGREIHYPRTGILLASCIQKWGAAQNITPVLLFLDGAVRNHRARFGLEIELNKVVQAVLSEAVNQHNPVMAGVVAPYSHVANTAALVAETIRKLSPEIPLITGGPHNSFLAPELLLGENPLFDAVVIGPGEAKLKHIISHFANPQKRFDFPGICTKTNPVPKAEEAFQNKCEDIPLLDLSLFNPQEYGFSRAMIMGGRGCPNACRYCLEHSYWRRAPVPFYQTVAAMRHEVDELKKYGIIICGCMDSTFDTGHPGFQVFCEEVIANAGGRFDFAVMMNLEKIKKEACQIFARTGGRRFMLGLESGDEQMRKTMKKKNYDPDYLKKQLGISREAGIKNLSFVLLGYPGETEDSLKRSLDFVQKLCEEGFIDEVEPFVFSPYPGLPMYTDPQRFGIIPKLPEWHNWDNWDRHNPPPYDLENLGGEKIFAAWKEAAYWREGKKEQGMRMIKAI